MSVEKEVRDLASKYASDLEKKIRRRVKQMKEDDRSHYLLYKVLGVAEDEWELVDVYQNKGRYLYRYAGSLLENAARLCFEERYPEAEFGVRIPNTVSRRPKKFEIDCLIGEKAHEIKWRDATTDGDHVRKEHNRLEVISDAGYTPVRVMFYYPNRKQARGIQQRLEKAYEKAGGHYYYGQSAWDYIQDYTGVDLKRILSQIAEDNA